MAKARSAGGEVIALRKKAAEKKPGCLRPACTREDVQEHGYCSWHKYCHDVLMLIQSIGYPQLWINQFFLHLGGRAEWEKYALVLPPPVSGRRVAQIYTAADQYRRENFPADKETETLFKRFREEYIATKFRAPEEVPF